MTKVLKKNECRSWELSLNEINYFKFCKAHGYGEFFNEGLRKHTCW